MMRKVYLLLAIIGFVLPYYFFISFLVENSLDLQLLFSQLFANNISTFFAVDLIITALVFLLFLSQEAPRYQMANWWAYVVAALLVGPSFALPLFPYFREARIQALAPPEATG
jgi:hypothetical protein